jgi:hypothetical protein
VAGGGEDDRWNVVDSVGGAADYAGTARRTITFSKRVASAAATFDARSHETSRCDHYVAIFFAHQVKVKPLQL